MAIRAVTNSAGSGDVDNLLVTSNDFNLTTSDSYVIGGWVDIDSLSPTNSYIFNNNYIGGLIFSLFVDSIANRFGFAISGGSVFVNGIITTRIFILAWIDPVANTVNLQIDNGIPASSVFTPAGPFTNTQFRFFGIGSPGNGITAILDNWFYCKNPPSLSSAVSLAQSTIYNSNNGIQYDDLSPGDKTTLGLVSWWGMDELGLATRTDSQGTNDLTVLGTFITDTDPLVESPGQNLFLNLNEGMFFDDALSTSPILHTLNESISLSAWLSVKLNPPVSHWTD